jgi:6-pyruvoyltetrahydropterin/6-carboxytetrahydropterin synthase
VKVWKEFTFEAAHSLPSGDPSDPNARLHGHSYMARVYLEGALEDGMVMHMNDLQRVVDAVRVSLDHRNLNDVLARPTLENIAKFIAFSLHDDRVVRVDVWRPTCGDGAIWGA